MVKFVLKFDSLQARSINWTFPSSLRPLKLHGAQYIIKSTKITQLNNITRDSNNTQYCYRCYGYIFAARTVCCIVRQSVYPRI